MIRILVVTNMYPPHHLGGYELACRDVVERWRASGHDVTVLTSTMRLPGVEMSHGERTSDVRRELGLYYRDHKITRPPPSKRLRIEHQNHRAWRRTLEDVRPDVASFWHMGALSMSLIAAAARSRLPSVAVLGDPWPVYAPELDPWIGAFERRPRLARVVGAITRIPTTPSEQLPDAAFCYASEHLRDIVAPRTRFAPRYSAVVHHGIDRGDFRPSADAERPWRGRLLCAGRLDERKGVHVAIRALATLPNATLDVLGRGDDAYLSTLRALAANLGVTDRVRFDEVGRSELAAAYAAADALLFPVVWDEPFGLVPLEAMACGTPVVTTATGGSAEFCRDGINCVVVQRDDHMALASAVKRLEADVYLRRRLALNGPETAARFDIDRTAAELEAWHLAAAERFADGAPKLCDEAAGGGGAT